MLHLSYMWGTTISLRPQDTTGKTRQQTKIGRSCWASITLIPLRRKGKVKRESLAHSKNDSSSGVTHAVDLANQAPMFEGTSENAINPVTYKGSLSITEIIDVLHNNTTDNTKSESPKHPKTQAAPKVISDIIDPDPKPFAAPPGTSTYPPTISSRERKRTVSSRMK